MLANYGLWFVVSEKPHKVKLRLTPQHSCHPSPTVQGLSRLLKRQTPDQAWWSLPILLASSGAQAYTNQDVPIQGEFLYLFPKLLHRDRWERSPLTLNLSISPLVPPPVCSQMWAKPVTLTATGSHSRVAYGCHGCYECEQMRQKKPGTWERYSIRSLYQPTLRPSPIVDLPIMWASQFPYWLSKFESGFLILLKASQVKYYLTEKSIWYPISTPYFNSEPYNKSQFSYETDLISQKQKAI